LVDCSKDGNLGCRGGDLWIAYTYLKTHKSMLDEDYKYTAKDETCKYDDTKFGV